MSADIQAKAPETKEPHTRGKHQRDGTASETAQSNDVESKNDSKNQDNKKRQRAVCRNHNRGIIFRKWLLDTFPPSAFASILDVAGGKGDVSIPLCIAGYRSTIIDPRICDLSKNSIVKNLAYHLEKKDTKTYAALKEKLGEEQLEQRGLPMPGELRECFRFIPPERAPRKGHEGEDMDSPEMTALKQEGTLLVGMHPDEATEPIVDYALAKGLPFAILPCCVFPKDNPHRRHPETGKAVNSYEDYLTYLQAKVGPYDAEGVSGIKKHQFEEFDGRNVVLFHTGRQQAEERATCTASTEVKSDE